MASRTKQKEEARARRLAEEQARSEQAQRNRRLQMLGGVIVVAIAAVAVAIAISSSGSTAATKLTNVKGGKTCIGATDSGVCSLLAGIPESGNTLGSPKAPVTVTEYGDLECPICRDFATQGIENQLISNDVKAGRVKLVFRSLETATGNAPNPGIFGVQQASALAAGQQDKEWYYIEFFYHYQGPETTGYVTQAYLNNLAKHVPGLNFNTWLAASHSQPLLTQVSQDESSATSKGFNSTPTLVIAGPKGQTQPIVGVPTSYNQLESAVKAVS